MSPLILAVLVVIAVGAVGFAVAPSLVGSSRASKRMKALQGDYQANRRTNQAQRSRDDRRRNIQQTLKQQTEALQRKKTRIPLQAQIFQAGMRIRDRDFIRNGVIIGLVAAALLWLVGVPLIFLPVFGLLFGYVVPKFYLGRRRKRYQNRFLDELPNAVEAIVRGVKSGLPLNDSMRLVAKEAKEPVKSEFQRVLDQQSVGKSMAEAVAVLFDRIPLPEVNFFVVVITVQQQAGGNLSEALSNLSRVLRNRKKMKAKVKAISSEAKASAGIVGSLPFLVGGLVSLTTPGYMAPLFSTQIGLIWFGVAVILMGTGIFVMNRMIQIEF